MGRAGPKPPVGDGEHGGVRVFPPSAGYQKGQSKWKGSAKPGAPCAGPALSCPEMPGPGKINAERAGRSGEDRWMVLGTKGCAAAVAELVYEERTMAVCVSP
jgi:hypothetical protein